MKRTRPLSVFDQPVDRWSNTDENRHEQAKCVLSLKKSNTAWCDDSSNRDKDKKFGKHHNTQQQVLRSDSDQLVELTIHVLKARVCVDFITLVREKVDDRIERKLQLYRLSPATKYHSHANETAEY